MLFSDRRKGAKEKLLWGVGRISSFTTSWVWQLVPIKMSLIVNTYFERGLEVVVVIDYFIKKV